MEAEEEHAPEHGSCAAGWTCSNPSTRDGAPHARWGTARHGSPRPSNADLPVSEPSNAGALHDAKGRHHGSPRGEEAARRGQAREQAEQEDEEAMELEEARDLEGDAETEDEDEEAHAGPGGGAECSAGACGGEGGERRAWRRWSEQEHATLVKMVKHNEGKRNCWARVAEQ